MLVRWCASLSRYSRYGAKKLGSKTLSLSFAWYAIVPRIFSTTSCFHGQLHHEGMIAFFDALFNSDCTSYAKRVRKVVASRGQGRRGVGVLLTNDRHGKQMNMTRMDGLRSRRVAPLSRLERFR